MTPLIRCIGHRIIFYNHKTHVKERVDYFHRDWWRERVDRYDPNTGRIISATFYNADGTVAYHTNYDGAEQTAPSPITWTCHGPQESPR